MLRLHTTSILMTSSTGHYVCIQKPHVKVIFLQAKAALGHLQVLWKSHSVSHTAEEYSIIRLLSLKQDIITIYKQN